MKRSTFERLTVDNDQDVVVFLIGMRVRQWWRVDKWLPVAMAMPRMIRELKNDPALGYLGAQDYFGVSIQYWQSLEHLLRYAKSNDHAHRPAWTAFYKKAAASRAVGIWHETYFVRRRQYECVYGNMPPQGLGSFRPRIPASGHRDAASDRLRLDQ